MPANRFEEEDEFDGLSYGDYLQSAFGGAATGAAAGLAFSPVGGVIGGLAGLGVGLADSASQQRQLEAAFAQQQELNRELSAAGLDAETFAQNAALQGGMAAERAEAEAGFSGRRAGLSPAQTIALQQQGRTDAQLAGVQAQAPMLQAAQQARSQRQQDILNQYQVAQMLQDNSQTPGLSESFSSAAQAAAALGTLRGQPDAAATKINQGAEDTSKLTTAFAAAPEEDIRPYISPIVPQSQEALQSPTVSPTPVSASQSIQPYMPASSPPSLGEPPPVAAMPSVGAIQGSRASVNQTPTQQYELGSTYEDWLAAKRFDNSGQSMAAPTGGYEGSNIAQLANEAARPVRGISPVALAGSARTDEFTTPVFSADENSALGRVFATLDEGGTIQDLDLQGTGMDTNQIQTIQRIFFGLQYSQPGTRIYQANVEELIELVGGNQ